MAPGSISRLAEGPTEVCRVQSVLGTEIEGAVFGVNWDSIAFNVGAEVIKRILMNEPLRGTKSPVEELLESSPSAEDLVRNLTA